MTETIKLIRPVKIVIDDCREALIGNAEIEMDRDFSYTFKKYTLLSLKFKSLRLSVKKGDSLL